MTNPDCPACHGTGVLRTHDHIGIVDESNCDLCPQPDPTPHQPYTCAEREWLIARVAELEAELVAQWKWDDGSILRKRRIEKLIPAETLNA